MNNLTTRKIIFGLLMTLVLAFGVQGVVDAVITDLTTTAESTSRVDITARQIGSGINSISVAGVASGTSIVIDPTLEDTADSPGTGTDTTNTNESIRVSTSNIQLTSPTFTSSTVTFSESTAEDKQTTTSRRLTDGDITLTGYFLREGVATLTITYTDLPDSQSNASRGSTTSKSLTHKYTYYVVKSDTNIPETTTFSLAGASSRGYQTGLNGRTDFSLYSNSSGNYPVTYSLAFPASGATLYFHDDPYMATDPAIGTTISSSSRRKVWLDMNGSEASSTFDAGVTSVVRVRIGSNDSTTGNIVKSDFNVVYIIGTPKLGIRLTAGTDITTVENDETKKYIFSGGTAGADAGTITATVMDGASAPVGIVGALVKFELRTKGSTAGYLSVGGTGTQVDDKNNSVAGAMLPSDTQTLYVRTGTGGVATATYEFGTLGSQEITVSSVGLSEKVTAEFGTSAVFKEISGEPVKQQSGNPKKYDLVAVVKEGKEFTDDMVVTFTTNQGTLMRVSGAPTLADHGVAPINTGRFVNVVTNSQGKAVVVYDIGDNTGRQEIHASIYDNNLIDNAGALNPNPNVINYDNASSDPGVSETTFRQYHTFVVNGSARRDPPPPAPPPQTTNRLTISTTGEGLTRSVTVNALTAADVSVPGLSVLLSGTALTTPQTVTTGTAVTITLPSTPDTYTLIATDPNGTFDLGNNKYYGVSTRYPRD